MWEDPGGPLKFCLISFRSGRVFLCLFTTAEYRPWLRDSLAADSRWRRVWLFTGVVRGCPEVALIFEGSTTAVMGRTLLFRELLVGFMMVELRLGTLLETLGLSPWTP